MAGEGQRLALRQTGGNAGAEGGHEGVACGGGVLYLRHADAGGGADSIRRTDHRAIAAQGDHHLFHTLFTQSGGHGVQIVLIHAVFVCTDGSFLRQNGSLMLVGRQPCGAGKQLRRHGSGGSGVQHHRNTSSLGAGSNEAGGLHGDLQLEHHQIVILHTLAQPLQILGAQVVVGAGDNENTVLGAMLRHLQLDIRHAGGMLRADLHPGNIHASCGRGRQQFLAEGIVAHAAHHGDLSAQTGALNGLVGALAAGGSAEFEAGDGLAHIGYSGGRCDQIHHKAAHYKNLRFFQHIYQPLVISDSQVQDFVSHFISPEEKAQEI